MKSRWQSICSIWKSKFASCERRQSPEISVLLSSHWFVQLYRVVVDFVEDIVSCSCHPVKQLQSIYDGVIAKKVKKIHSESTPPAVPPWLAWRKTSSAARGLKSFNVHFVTSPATRAKWTKSSERSEGRGGRADGGNLFVVHHLDNLH